MIAQVVPAVRLPNGASDIYDYQVPEALAAGVVLGAVVIVPFAGRKVAALVVGLSTTTKFPKQLKTIVGLAQDLSPLPPYIPKLWQKAAQVFATSFSHLVWSALPQVPARRVRVSFTEPLTKAASTDLGKTFSPRFFWINDEQDHAARLCAVAAEYPKQQVLIVVPTVREAESYQKIIEQSVVYHSGLSVGARYALSVDAAVGKPMVVIGTRQAAFLPLADLAAIVIVSSGASAHKNEDSDPRYDGRIMCSLLARATGAKLCACDTLPPLGQTAQGSQRRWQDMNEPLSYPCSVLDLREVQKRERNRVHVSEELLSEIDKTVTAGGRCLVYLNRRGLAAFYACRDCRTLVVCPGCGIALTVFADHTKCPECEKKFPLPTACLKCHGLNLSTVGSGSKSIYELLKKRYPDLSVIHLDRDEAVANPDAARIVVGTSAVFTALTNGRLRFNLVADAFFGAGTAMNGVAGVESAARHARHLAAYLAADGIFCVQTIDPAAPALLAVTDPREFIEREARERKEFGYPPFKTEIVVYGAGTVESELWSAAKELFHRLSAEYPEADLTAPTWSEPKIFRGKYRLSLAMRLSPSQNRENLVKFLPKGFAAEAKIL